MVVATDDKQALTSLQNQAYNAAWSRIRQKYRDEYDAAVDEEFAKRGLERRKRSTAEQRQERLAQERKQRATERLDKLLADNPELREHLKERVL